MNQKKVVKSRTCKKCSKTIETDAKGIKTHAINCEGSTNVNRT